MPYIIEIQNILDYYSLGIILELLLVTSCISTIIYLLTKNQYVSYLSSAPIIYIISSLQHGPKHLFLLVVAMFVQSLVIVAIQYQRKKKIIQKVQEKIVTN